MHHVSITAALQLMRSVVTKHVAQCAGLLAALTALNAGAVHGAPCTLPADGHQAVLLGVAIGTVCAAFGTGCFAGAVELLSIGRKNGTFASASCRDHSSRVYHHAIADAK